MAIQITIHGWFLQGSECGVYSLKLINNCTSISNKKRVAVTIKTTQPNVEPMIKKGTIVSSTYSNKGVALSCRI